MRLQIARYLSLAVLLVSGVLGLYNGSSEWAEGRTAFQHSVTFGVLAYGVLGLATAWGIIRRRRWSVHTAIAYAVAVTYVPGAATLAYAEGTAPVVSAIVASFFSGLIGAGIVWTARAVERQESHLRD